MDWKSAFQNMSPEMKEQVMNMAKARVKEKLKKWFSLPVLTVLALVMGAVVGALTACFGDILLKLTDLRSTHPLYFIPFLAGAGALIVFAYHKFGRYTDRGMGMIFAVGQGKENEIPLRLIPMVAVGTWLTHLFGGSAGREGVAVQIGACFGYNISKKLPFENASHIMLVAGMAAGFAGLFQTPMAATAFALEVMIVGHLDLMALLPAVVAAFTACKVSNLLGLEKFSVDLNEFLGSAAQGVAGGDLDWTSPAFYAKLAVLGVVFGVVGGGFAKVLSLSKGFFAKKFPNPIKRIVILGACLSAVFLLFFQGRYSGLGTNLIDMCFGGAAVDGGAAIYNFDWLLKFALTIVTLSAGFIGGEVTPLFAIGATLGTAVAALLGVPLPLAAALGYAAVFGSASNTLWAPILIGCEVFGFQCLPAFFIVCAVAYVCNGGVSIYSQRKIRFR